MVVTGDRTALRRTDPGDGRLMAAKLERTRTPGIYRRGTRYVVTYRDAEGKQRKESARTLDDARKLKAARETEVATGQHLPASRLRFDEYALEWVGRYQGRGSRGFRDTTRDEYRRDLERFAIPYFTGKLRRTVEQVTPRDVANFIAWLCDETEQGKRKATESRKGKAERKGVEPGTLPLSVKPHYLADRTVRRILSPLSACFASAVAEGLVVRNPVTGVALPARDQQRRIDQGTDGDRDEVKALSDDALERFLYAARTMFLVEPEDGHEKTEAEQWAERKWEVFFRLLSATGLRWSEIVEVRWSDLELTGNPMVKVRRAFPQKATKPGPPKSRYSRRDIPLPAILAADLADYRKHGTEWFGPDELVFTDARGGHLRQENVRRRVLAPLANAAATEQEVGTLGFHHFRHTCGTRLFAEGRNAVQVQRFLGHHSPAFTLSTYVHLLNEDLGGALEEAQGGNRVATEATETARNSTQSNAFIPH
jgi:integrase